MCQHTDEKPKKKPIELGNSEIIALNVASPKRKGRQIQLYAFTTSFVVSLKAVLQMKR